MITRKQRIIVPLKSYAPVNRAPKVAKLPTPDERVKAIELKIAAIANDLATAKDRIRRMREVIESEIAYWEKGINENQWDGIDAVKRRLSRLKGSLLYPGIAGFGREEEL